MEDILQDTAVALCPAGLDEWLQAEDAKFAECVDIQPLNCSSLRGDLLCPGCRAWVVTTCRYKTRIQSACFYGEYAADQLDSYVSTRVLYVAVDAVGASSIQNGTQNTVLSRVAHQRF